MKTNVKFEIKGVQVEMAFEGSIKELMALNTSMVVGSKEWLKFFDEEGNHIFNLIDAAIDRAKVTSMKVKMAEKELDDLGKIINKK